MQSGVHRAVVHKEDHHRSLPCSRRSTFLHLTPELQDLLLGTSIYQIYLLAAWILGALLVAGTWLCLLYLRDV